VGACFSTLEMNLNRFSLLFSSRFDIFDGENKFYISLRLWSLCNFSLKQQHWQVYFSY
jgi:hypothetical protein